MRSPRYISQNRPSFLQIVKPALVLVLVLFFRAVGYAGGALLQDNSANTAPQIDTAKQAGDANNPDSALTAGQQQSPQSEYFGKETDRPVSAHKLNYFSANHWPMDANAQVKFQISMKFRVLEPNLYILKHNFFPAYVAYTQKSLWNTGQQSLPFEENNYNPEFFLDYPVDAALLGRLKLRNIVVSPIEHESNGLSGAQSRSWNRQYVLFRLGLEAKEKLDITNSFLADKALLYIKLWHASGYSDQDDYLQSGGSSDTFLDYMGHGEIGISIRNFFWGGSLRDHQLDIKTPIFRDTRKSSYEVEFRQQLPYMNFALYFQYWYGYGETLLRFDQFGHRGFAGLSFSY
jgi:phospholipase A1